MNRLEAQTFHEKLKELFREFGRVALLTMDNQTVFLKYQMLTDLGTLPHSAEVGHKYLQLQDGDIVLTNDPYSGGTILTSPTLILGVGTRQVKNTTAAEYLVATRFALVPKIGDHKTIDEEGLRVPPSPFFIKGQINTPIVEALRAHPQAPRDFIRKAQECAERLLNLRERLKKMLTSGDLDLGKSNVRSYLQTTEREFLRRLDEVGEGSASVAIDLGASESMRLKVEHHDGGFTFDFNGTTAGQGLFLTDSATIGACVGATISLLGADVPINSGIFGRFDVKTPRGSMVNSTFPRPAFLGHTDGPDIIANLVTKAFGLIHKKQAWAASGATHCFYQLSFKSGKVYYDGLPAGTGAREGRHGLNGSFLWFRIPIVSHSVEQIEKDYPIQFLGANFRSNSGGEGQTMGGLGAVRTIRLLEDAELGWAHMAPPHKPEGLNGGKSALGPEMIVQRATGEKEELAPRGHMQLRKGDVLSVLSPGGGGYGTKVSLT